MTRGLSASLVIAVCITVGAVAWAGSDNLNQVAEAKWEYKLLTYRDVANNQDNAKAATGLESRFNELGKDGWEFVGTVGGGAGVFKRATR